MNRIIFPIGYYPNPTKGKPISGGSIYIGEPDTDPTVPGNQKTVTALQENGSEVSISQPILTSAGGVPLYNGSPVSLFVLGNYSMTVLDSLGSQLYYVPDNSISTTEAIEYFDTVSDMIAADLIVGSMYATKGYTTSGDGGGATYLIKTAAEYGASPDEYGDHTVNTDDVAVMQGNGPFSPLQFGVPLTSSGTDYQPNLQALLDKLYFVFPEGFESHTTTLYPRSNSIGDFRDAKFTLMPNQDSGVQIIVLGDASGYLCENSRFNGGVFDGDRDNQTANGNVGIAGGDGGLHCLQVHNATNVVWTGSPQFINAGTDGIIVWQRNAHVTYGTTSVNDVHIHNPICDNNSRQGISVIACSNINFYDTLCENTNGKAPEAGVDVEGNIDTDNIQVNFYGRTRCSSNNGRGFQTHNPGASISVYIESLSCISNLATDGQCYFYNASGDAFQSITMDRYSSTDSASVSLVLDNFAYTTETPNIDFKFGNIYADKRVHFDALSFIQGDKLTVFSNVISTTIGSLTIEADVSGFINVIETHNTSADSNAFPIILKGDELFYIGLVRTYGSRGLRFLSSQNKTVNMAEIVGTLLASAVYFVTSSKNTINADFKSAHANPGVEIPDGSDDNIVVATDSNASINNFLTVNGDRNIIKIKTIRSTGDVGAYFDTLSADNFIYSSYIKGATLGSITDLGTNNNKTGNFLL